MPHACRCSGGIWIQLNMLYLWASPEDVGQLEWMISEGHFQLNFFLPYKSQNRAEGHIKKIKHLSLTTMSGFAIKTAFQTKQCASGQSITADDDCFSVSQSRNMPCFTRKVAGEGRGGEKEGGLETAYLQNHCCF